MPIRLSDLRKKTRVIEVIFQDEPVSITYLVNAVTPELLSEKPDAVEQVKAVVSAWDIVDDQGKLLLPSEIAEKLPTQFLNAVLTAVMDDMRGTDEKKG